MPNIAGGDQLHPAYAPWFWEKVARASSDWKREYDYEGWHYRFALTKKGAIVADRILLKELRDITGPGGYERAFLREVPKHLLKMYKMLTARARARRKAA